MLADSPEPFSSGCMSGRLPEHVHSFLGLVAVSDVSEASFKLCRRPVQALLQLLDVPPQEGALLNLESQPAHTHTSPCLQRCFWELRLLLLILRAHKRWLC